MLTVVCQNSIWDTLRAIIWPKNEATLLDRRVGHPAGLVEIRRPYIGSLVPVVVPKLLF